MIETKFNIGDRLFYFGDAEILSFIVKSVRVEIHEKGATPDVTYFEDLFCDTNGLQKSEDTVFADLAGCKKFSSEMFKAEIECINS